MWRWTGTRQPSVKAIPQIRQSKSSWCEPSTSGPTHHPWMSSWMALVISTQSKGTSRTAARTTTSPPRPCPNEGTSDCAACSAMRLASSGRLLQGPRIWAGGTRSRRCGRWRDGVGFCSLHRGRRGLCRAKMGWWMRWNWDRRGMLLFLVHNKHHGPKWRATWTTCTT